MPDSLSSVLSSTFPVYGDIFPYVSHVSGEFSLSDSVSCANPGNKPGCEVACSKEILKINVAGTVGIISLDEWIKSASGKSRCDYLVYDVLIHPKEGNGKELRSGKLAFCELTCTNEKYVNPYRTTIGKRAKAIDQIITTWNNLSSIAAVNSEFQKFSEIIGIFGWRDPIEIAALVSMPRTSPEGSMGRFMMTPSRRISGTILLGTTFGVGYRIFQQKYPYTYNW